MLRLVRTNLEESREHPPVPRAAESGEGMRRFPGLHDDILSLRQMASSSDDPQARLFAAHALCDIDSFAFVLGNSGHADSCEIAKKGLERRLDSFSDEAVRHLAISSDSEHVRSCAQAVLEKRK